MGFIASGRGVSSEELVVKKCYCNRDFTVAEITNIISELRKKENVHLEQQYHGKDPLYINAQGVQLIKKGKSGYYTLDGKLSQKDDKGIQRYKVSKSKYDELGTTIFQSIEIEKIQTKDANLTSFTNEINKTFSNYQINTCIRKIHFLAQTYHESERFVNTYEGLTTVPSNYKGGVDFQGRGIKQITHDYNYLEYYDKVNKTTLFNDKFRKRKNISFGLTEYLKSEKNHGFPDNFLETLKKFAKKLSTELSYACDSAGWYWDKNKINNAADQDNITQVTTIINGSTTGINERKKYANDLKIIFNYDTCSNKK